MYKSFYLYNPTHQQEKLTTKDRWIRRNCALTVCTIDIKSEPSLPTTTCGVSLPHITHFDQSSSNKIIYAFEIWALLAVAISHLKKFQLASLVNANDHSCLKRKLLSPHDWIDSNSYCNPNIGFPITHDIRKSFAVLFIMVVVVVVPTSVLNGASS